MNLPGLLHQSKQSFAEFWEARDKRERALLATAAIVAALGMTYALLIDPALSGRERLNKSLPELRQQVAQLQALSQEAAAYAAVTAPPLTAITAESLKAALETKDLKPQNVTMSGDLARVQLAAASFAGTISWLDEMQKTARILVVEANIVPLDKPDTVNATLTLRQQKKD